MYKVSTEYADIYRPLLTMLTADSPVPGLRLQELGEDLLYIPHTLHTRHTQHHSPATSNTIQHSLTRVFVINFDIVA